MSVYGFTKHDFGSDYALASFLRDQTAIDAYELIGNAGAWYAPDGRSVVVAFYDNTACTYVSWVRDDLLPV